MTLMPGEERTSTHVRFRPALPSESALLSGIAHDAKARWGYPADLLELWSDELCVSPEFIVANYVCCACIGGETVGFAAVCESADGAELEHMWVRPDRMGQGVGRDLLEHVLEDMHARGVPTLRVVSDPNAEGFYLRMGARRVGETDSIPPGRRLPLLVLEAR